MKKYIFCIFLVPLMAVACSLKENIESSSVKENYYRTFAQCKTGLNGCYIPLETIYGNFAYFEVCECQGDMMFFRKPTLPNSILLVSQSQPQFGSTMWTQGYLGVMRCNAMEAAINKSPLSVSEKNTLLAENVILRAFYYYFLTSNFGDVPFYEEEVVNANNDSIARLPRYSSSKIREKMTGEIRDYILDRHALPIARTYDVSTNPQYRAGAALGLMLAGRMCLWDGRWNEAVEFFSELEKVYGNLEAYPLADVKFRNKYTPESIFEIGYTSEDYGLQVYHSLSHRCLPNRSSTSAENPDENEDIEQGEDHSDIYAGIGIPELGTNAKTSGAIRPTQKLRALLPYAGNDKRTCSNKASGDVEDGGGYLAWGWYGYDPDDDRSVVKPKWRWFKSGGSAFTQNSRPYLGDKFWCFGMNYSSDHNNVKIFRYAGALLGLAEAWCNLGDLDKAVDYLNMVRRRANVPEYEAGKYSASEIHDLIIQESGVELFGEFTRKQDLVRWGVWDEYMDANTESTLLNSNRKPCHRFYPIPSEQLTYSGGALDNKEYDECGL